MITILTTISTFENVKQHINSIERLNELVTVSHSTDTIEDIKTLVVTKTEINIHIDWYDLEPPYLIPATPFNKKNLLALVFYKLGNHQKAFEYVEEGTPLYQHIRIATHLQFGYEISPAMLNFCSNTSAHNTAIVNYYGIVENSKNNETLNALFSEAMNTAENDELKVYSAKHYLNLLLDNEELKFAQQLTKKSISIAISEDAKNAMNTHLASILMAQLQLPYKQEQLNKIHSIQKQAISHFEEKKLHVQAGMLLVDAAEIANFKEDFITSKELINRAIQYFKQEDIPEFLGEAGFKKALLLYTWSKNGSPQYYKAAINAFQDVLKIFKRDTHPQKFADVHHNLALIYSEIPVSSDEKPMWTAFCASSFKEVLAFYTKEHYPYEHAMVCHNYATALMDFPPAKIHDNLKKAADLFNKALQIRTAKTYPFERTLTLLNQLELGWITHNEDSLEEQKKYEEMKSKAQEIVTLVNDADLVAKANEHLIQLEKVKSFI